MHAGRHLDIDTGGTTPIEPDTPEPGVSCPHGVGGELVADVYGVGGLTAQSTAHFVEHHRIRFGHPHPTGDGDVVAEFAESQAGEFVALMLPWGIGHSGELHARGG